MNDDTLASSDAPQMPKHSKYAGQVADLSSRRSIQIVARDDDANGLEGSWVVDDFYHQEQFWRARIPMRGTSEVLGQAFNFSKPRMRKTADGKQVLLDRRGLPKRTIPCLYHVQSRFRFHRESPIELYELDCPLDKIDSTAPAVTLHDLVYSLEATGPAGTRFNFRDAWDGNLVSAHRMLSVESMVFERIVIENQTVTQSPPLPVGDDDRMRLLAASLERSGSAANDETYYLYRFLATNNCTSNPLQILDRTVKYGWMGRLGAFLYRLPLSPRFYLWVRGMDSDAERFHLVRDEFSAFIESKDTQRRKRQYVKAQIAKKRAADQAAQS